MNKFKKQIMKYFIVCAFGIAVVESMLDSTFDEVVFPGFEDNIVVAHILLGIYFLLIIAIFILFAALFYRLTNIAIKKESNRQLNKQNMVYSCIAHDLKTPMTSIQGFASALLEERIKPEEQKEIFDIIYNKSCYMNELVESLFTYSKLNTNDCQLSYSKMDLTVLVREIVALNYDEFEKKEICLGLEIPEEPIWCLLDEKEIKRAINNLIINAYMHNENDAKVMIQVKRQEKYVYIIIADNGKTISKEQEENIFEPFVSGNDARSSGEGNGLGLAISRIIIEKHEGKLYITNNIRDYTKGFVVQLQSV